MINLLAAATLDLNEAWNLSWGEGTSILVMLMGAYWYGRKDMNFSSTVLIFKNESIEKQKISWISKRNSDSTNYVLDCSKSV